MRPTLLYILYIDIVHNESNMSRRSHGLPGPPFHDRSNKKETADGDQTDSFLINGVKLCPALKTILHFIKISGNLMQICGYI